MQPVQLSRINPSGAMGAEETSATRFGRRIQSPRRSRNLLLVSLVVAGAAAAFVVLGGYADSSTGAGAGKLPSFVYDVERPEIGRAGEAVTPSAITTGSLREASALPGSSEPLSHSGLPQLAPAVVVTGAHPALQVREQGLLAAEPSAGSSDTVDAELTAESQSGASAEAGAGVVASGESGRAKTSVRRRRDTNWTGSFFNQN